MLSKNQIVLGACVIAFLVIVGAAVVRVYGPLGSSRPDTTGKPNILMIMTDDETLESVRVLDNVKRLIGQDGTTFSDYLVSFPNCCPSRATYLTGQFSHNDGVQDNVAPFGGFAKLKSDETLPVWLQRAGYYTASIGKYLNGWGADGHIEVPPGWDHWYGLIDPSTYKYYDFSVSENGTKKDFGHGPSDYQTDVLGSDVVRTIESRADSGQAWFLSWTPLAPHAQEREVGSGEQGGSGSIAETFPTPSPTYKGTLAGQKLAPTASFNQADNSKLPEYFRVLPELNPKTQELVAQQYQAELEALKSVDEWVGKIFDTLRRTGQLDNTVVMFTSDNGMFHGEHRIVFSKVYLYEAAVHLPLMIRGGPFPKGVTAPGIAGNVDLTPTILHLAGATSPLTLDGRNLAVLAADPTKGTDRGMLLENLTRKGAAHSEAIRTTRYKYITNEHNEEELYDLQVDPDEIINLATSDVHQTIKADLVKRLGALKACQGSTCEGADGKGS